MSGASRISIAQRDSGVAPLSGAPQNDDSEIRDVYILASKRNGTLYIGVTNNLVRRIYEHKNHLVKGFTEKYNVSMLVYFEQTSDIETALQREKQLKKWNRKWKLALIEKDNPDWNDLSRNWIPDQVGNDGT